MPAGIHPNSLANLRPIPLDQRHEGKRPGHRAKIKAFMQVLDGLHPTTGVELTEEDQIVLKAIELAKMGDFRSRNFLFDRLYGKPVETVKTTGTVTNYNLSEEQMLAAIEKRKAELSGEGLTDGDKSEQIV